MTISDEAEEANDLGNQAPNYQAAEPHFLRAIELAPGWAMPLYNLGLAYKYARLWEKSLQYNALAHQLDPEDDAIRWNLGIALTALERWDEAGQIWASFGLKAPIGLGPPDYDLGAIVVRVDPDGNPETLWCRRLDPARAVITSVPTPACQRRFGDIVLTDGAADGYRGTTPVVNELQLLQPSSFATYEARIICKSSTKYKQLQRRAEKRGWSAEDWTGNLRQLCIDCSHESQPIDRPKTPWKSEREIGLAAPAEGLDDLLIDYRVLSLERVL